MIGSLRLDPLAPSGWLVLARRLYQANRTQAAVQLRHVRAKYQVLGIVALLGFPAYWLVWTWLYPQPYENLGLRLIGAVLSLPLIAAPWLPGWVERRLDIYRVIYALYVLPFFFTFMCLMNGANAVWQMSLIASILYLTLFFEAVRLVLVHLAGSLLALLAFRVVSPDMPVPAGYFEAWPIHAFALAGGALFNYAAALTRLEVRLTSAAAVGASVAHEVRTPLLAIRLDSAAVLERWPEVAAGGGDAEDRAALTAALGRIDQQARAAGATVDMLLANVAGPRGDMGADGPHSVAAIVQAALDRYPFKGSERARVTAELADDFAVQGSALLLTHVVFNLLKNALRAVAEAGRGTVTLRLDCGPGGNRLTVSDTGSGIPPALMPRIFEPFVAGPRGGAGLGLAFCRNVVEGLGGSITVSSFPGAETHFVVRFPVATDNRRQ